MTTFLLLPLSATFPLSLNHKFSPLPPLRTASSLTDIPLNINNTIIEKHHPQKYTQQQQQNHQKTNGKTPFYYHLAERFFYIQQNIHIYSIFRDRIYIFYVMMTSRGIPQNYKCSFVFFFKRNNNEMK